MDSPKQAGKLFEVGDIAFIPLMDAVVEAKIVSITTEETINNGVHETTYYYVPDPEKIKMNGVEMEKYRTREEAINAQLEIRKDAKLQTYAFVKLQLAQVLSVYGDEGVDEITKMVEELGRAFREVRKEEVKNEEGNNK